MGESSAASPIVPNSDLSPRRDRALVFAGRDPVLDAARSAVRRGAEPLKGRPPGGPVLAGSTRSRRFCRPSVLFRNSTIDPMGGVWCCPARHEQNLPLDVG